MKRLPSLDMGNIIALCLFSMLTGVSAISTLFMLFFLYDVGAWVWLGVSGILTGILAIARCKLYAFYSALIPFGIVVGIIIGFFGPANWLWCSYFRLF